MDAASKAGTGTHPQATERTGNEKAGGEVKAEQQAVPAAKSLKA
jgi:hypothetical protein